MEVGCLAYGMHLVVDDDGYGGARLASQDSGGREGGRIEGLYRNLVMSFNEINNCRMRCWCNFKVKDRLKFKCDFNPIQEMLLEFQ